MYYSELNKKTYERPAEECEWLGFPLLSNLRNMGLDFINNVVSSQFTSGEEFLVIL